MKLSQFYNFYFRKLQIQTFFFFLGCRKKKAKATKESAQLMKLISKSFYKVKKSARLVRPITVQIGGGKKTWGGGD